MYVQDQRSKRRALQDLDDAVHRAATEAERNLTPEQRDERRREVEQYRREYEGKNQ